MPDTDQMVWRGGKSGDANNYANGENWSWNGNVPPISIRSATYSWTASGSGSDEWFLRTAASGNPNLNEPDDVQQNGTDMTTAALGSLAAGNWNWGDNDSLGYSTVYVRLTATGDPDLQAAGWVTFDTIPRADNDVTIAAESANAITSGLDQSAVEIDSFVVEEGFGHSIGTDDAFLQIDIDNAVEEFLYGGTGARAKIDVGAGTIDCVVMNTGSPATGEHGLELKGSNLANLYVSKGDVGIGTDPNDAGSDCTNIYVNQKPGATAKVTCGSTMTAGPALISMTGGELVSTGQSQGATTIKLHSAKMDWDGDGTIATLTARGASEIKLRCNTQTPALTITKTNMHDTSKCEVLQGVGAGITFTNIDMYKGSTWIDQNLFGTYSNAIQLEDGFNNVTLDFGPQVTLVPAAI